ncbi:hypothetical protein ABVN64_03010 [Mycolicibacterium conceptionense]|uniref:hypothetical protein n=1 Tax=Mycolicibacterium conceptionense TaxID=451644 RepID=UPI00336B635B
MTTTTLERGDSPYYRIKQDRFWIEIHENDLRPIGEAILDGLDTWAERAIATSTEVFRTTVSITPRGKVRISKRRDGYRDRYLMIEPRDAVDLAEELLNE